MGLTNTAIRNAKPGEKPRKLFDGGGLFLLITPKGQLWWRLKYRYQGKEKLLSLGTYPHVTLAQARQRRDDAKRLLADDVDPSDQRKAKAEVVRQSEKGSLAKVAEDWLAFKASGWSDETRRKAEYVTRTYLVPEIGKMSVATLQTKDVVQHSSQLAS